MKRTLFFMLLSAWLFAPATWAEDFDVDGIYYNITSSDDKTVEVTRGNYSGDVTIPETVTNEGIEYRVTAIGERAFASYDGLTSVTIPNSVTAISEGAFYRCTGLTSVTIPESVTAIGDYAFAGCDGLMSVTVYNLTPVNIDEKSVFYLVDCDNCTLYVPAESIALYKAAEGWKNFLNIKYKIDGIGYNILSSDERTAKVINGGYSGDIVIPETMEYEGITYRVTAIGEAAFWGCNGLTSVTIGKNVQTIGEEAFYWCSGLTSITIPESITAIGDWAFSGCSGLTSVTIPESVTAIGNGVFDRCTGLTEFKGKFASEYGRCLIVNDTLKAFAPKCDVAEYTIPDGVTAIGDEAFEDCQNLTSVTIPNSVTAIGDYAFEYCENLMSVTIGEGVTTIGDGAFEYCENLTSVTIGKSVTTIGERAFYGCDGLTSVTAYNPTPVDIVITNESGYTYFAFDGVDCANCTLYVPAESVELYKAAKGWSEFEEILPIVAYDFEAAPTITPVENDETITALSTFTLTFDERPALVGSSATVMKADSSAYYPARITASENGKSFIITLQGDEQTKAAEYSLTEAGTYLLVIPAGTFGDDVFAADPKTGHSNPELTYTYTIKAPEPVEPDEPDDPSSITETQADAEHITVYNLQGVLVLETDDAADLKTLQNGAYIVNGKTMIIAR